MFSRALKCFPARTGTQSKTGGRAGFSSPPLLRPCSDPPPRRAGSPVPSLTLPPPFFHTSTLMQLLSAMCMLSCASHHASTWASEKTFIKSKQFFLVEMQVLVLRISLVNS